MDGLDDNEEDLLGQGEEEKVVVKEKVVRERPKNRLNMPYWWRKYQLPAELPDKYAFVPPPSSEKWPVRVLLDDGVKTGDVEATQRAVDGGANVKHVSAHSGRAPIHDAILHGKHNIVQTLWNNGAEMDVPMPYTKDTALHLAAKANEFRSIRSLLKMEACADVVNKDGDTALHIAARLGHYESVKALLAGGIDPNIKNKAGKTAKEEAELNDFPELSTYILSFD